MADEARDPKPSVTRFGVTEWTYVCDRCGDRMIENKCKIVCGNCGYCRDCSDP